MTACCAVKPKSYFYEKLKLYRPLLAIVALSAGVGALSPQWGIAPMDGLMGAFLVLLAALKFVNLPGFAKSFARYDVVAGRFYAYALAYPFIELGLGALYLSGFFPMETNVATLAVMIVGSIGVVNVIRSGEALQCACVGANFNLPVGRVTLAENVAMAAMAIYNLMGMHV